MKQALRRIALPLSYLYGLGMHIRNYGYEAAWWKAKNADLFTISVGNISAGGTGKTPIAAFLIEWLGGISNIAYLSRGYGRTSKGFLWVDSSRPDPLRFGDEALEISQKFPNIKVAVCEDRVKGAEEIKAQMPEGILILDDAMQHRRIYRDIEIVVMDANHLPYHDCLLPAGNLREPLSALYRADIVVVNKLKARAEISTIERALSPYLSPNCPLIFGTTTIHTASPFVATLPSISLAEIPEAIAFSGIGNNDFFVYQLKQQGINIIQALDFPDHHVYTDKEISYMLELQKNNIPILTTSKDYARLKNNPALMSAPQLYYVSPTWTAWQGLGEMQALILEQLALSPR